MKDYKNFNSFQRITSVEIIKEILGLAVCIFACVATFCVLSIMLTDAPAPQMPPVLEEFYSQGGGK